MSESKQFCGWIGRTTAIPFGEWRGEEKICGYNTGMGADIVALTEYS